MGKERWPTTKPPPWFRQLAAWAAGGGGLIQCALIASDLCPMHCAANARDADDRRHAVPAANA